MKKVRILFIILTLMWMIATYCFSNQPADTSKNTSSSVTQKIVDILYGNKLSKEEIKVKAEELDPLIRKLAHYTLYTLGGILISVAVVTYDLTTKKKIFITQGIGSIYAITDEIHQYFVPR